MLDALTQIHVVVREGKVATRCTFYPSGLMPKPHRTMGEGWIDCRLGAIHDVVASVRKQRWMSRTIGGGATISIACSLSPWQRGACDRQVRSMRMLATPLPIDFLNTRKAYSLAKRWNLSKCILKTASIAEGNLHRCRLLVSLNCYLGWT